ncbi:MAG: hypothetical protein ACWGNO_00185 [Desulfobacterales bacterium]
MGHPAWQVTQRAYDYLKKNGMAQRYLDMLEIISDKEMIKEKQKQKDFEDGKKVEENL